MSELDHTSRFRKTFFFPTKQKHLERFTSLSERQQEAVVALKELGVDTENAFRSVEGADSEDLLLRFDETIEHLYLVYKAGDAI